MTGADSGLDLWNAIGATVTGNFEDFILHNITPGKDSLGLQNAYETMIYSDEQTAFKPTSTEQHWAAEIIANHLNSSAQASYLRNYYRNRFPCYEGYSCNNNDTMERWKDLLWDDETQALVNPLSTSYSLDYVAPGGLVFSRGDNG